MSNLTNFESVMLAQSLLALRENLRFPMNVLTSNVAGPPMQRGSTINITIPDSAEAYDVVPGHNPPNKTPGSRKVQLTLDKWKAAGFTIEDDDAVTANSPAAIHSLVSEHMRTLAGAIDAEIAKETKGFYSAIGTVGTTPFAMNRKVATTAKTVLDWQKCPAGMRNAFLSSEAETNFLDLADITRADARGDGGQAMRTGEPRMVTGINWWGANQMMPVVHQEDRTDGALLNGAAAKGARKLTIDTGQPAVGDIIWIGDAAATGNRTTKNTYVVTASSATEISIYPALRQDRVDNAKIGVLGDHSFSPILHPSSILFASRARAMANEGSNRERGIRTQTIVDAMSGLTLLFKVIPEYHQTFYEFSCLFGTEIIRPELGTRLLQ